MCHVKTNENIVTKQDLQNLITGIILRQQGMFTEKYLKKATDFFMMGSPLAVAESEIEDMIGNTLNVLRWSGKTMYHAGVYTHCPRYVRL